MASFLFGASYTGFNMLKLRARGGMPVAFADFQVTLAIRHFFYVDTTRVDHVAISFSGHWLHVDLGKTSHVNR